MEPRERSQGLVEFSASEIELVNDGCERQRHVYQLQNRSPGSLRVRAAIARDSDPVFHLLSGGEEKYLAPGLKLPVVLQYSASSAGSHRGSLEVYRNGSLVLSVPITALSPSPKLHLERDVVNFGTLVTDHQIYTTSFPLSNRGSKAGSFSIDVSPLPAWISLQPVEGQLEPKKCTDIQIEVLCKEEAEFSYALSIQPTEESSEVAALSVTLCGRLQSRTLRLMDLHSLSPLDCVTFDPTYYDTTTSRQVILYNDSPVATEFLCLLDTGARGSEVGVSEREGVALACTEGGVGQDRWREQGDAPTSEKLLRVDPAQDSLLPYEKRAVELTFAPTFVPSSSGWDHFQATPTRRDYALYIHFMAVGANREMNSPDLEVAVSACALPVDISLQPDSPLQFGVCPTTQTSIQLLKICNNSDTLPLPYHTHRLPHYTCHPPTGHIPPSRTHTLTLTFAPKQLGPLNAKLMIDILAPKQKGVASGQTRPSVVKTLAVELRGEGAVREGQGGRDQVGRRVTVKAHPDDLATSIRPHDGSSVITPYTHTPRYTYVDRDYAHSERERRQHQLHKDRYLLYLRDSQAGRQWRKKEKSLSDAVRGPERELGMLALKAPRNCPTLSTSPGRKKATGRREMRGGGEGDRGGGEKGSRGVMTTNDLLKATSIELHEVERCPSKPGSVQAANEVTSQLTPHQLSLVTITPCVLDCGRVAVGSIVERNVTVKNNLKQHVSVTFKLAGSGLQCPFSTSHPSPTLILPPSSFTHLPLTMHRSTEGILERCVEYCVNGRHTSRLPVRVEAVPLSLALFSHTLTLAQPRMATHTAGLRGCLEVCNAHNIPAAFQWHSREGVDTNVFFMLHPAGVIPAHSSLQCEFVCMPSHDSPESALFRLVVVDEGGARGDGGVQGERNAQKEEDNNFLTLKAELGHPVCSFKEQRVLFGSVPLGLTTTRTVHLQNTGEHHAYFQVVNPEPCPGLRVDPESGCVPVGGVTDLKLHLHPVSVAMFDTELVVRVRGGGRRLALKLVGAVEKPIVTVDRESFLFGGVYCGSTSSLPFTVTNMGSTRCQLTFDFSYLNDFSLILPKHSSPYAEVVSEAPTTEATGVHTLDLPATMSALCQLVLSPSDVAAYDFQLPVLVNGARPPSPPSSPWPPSSKQPSKIALSTQHRGKQDVLGSYRATPCRRVLATAVRAPLSLSLSLFSFSFPVGYLQTMTEPALHSQTAELKNVGDSPLTWSLVTAGISRLDDGTFRLVLPSGAPLPLPPVNIGPPENIRPPGEGEVGYLAPQESCTFSVQCSPGHHGEFSAEIPLFLNGNTTQPFSTVSLKASVPIGRISVSSDCISLQPVPLDITISSQYTITVEDFPDPVVLEAVVPALPDYASLVVRFPDGASVAETNQAAVELPVQLEFTSSEPVSLTGHLTFRDTNSGKKVRVAYAMAADNSVLSVAQFLAQSVTIASVQLNPHQVPTLIVSSPNGTAVSSSSTVSLDTSQGRELMCTPLSSALTEDASYSDIFLQECVSAVCRWVSSYGWAHGVRHVTSPTDLRERVGHDVPKRGMKQRSSIRVQRGLLVELVSHICGRLPPGIPMNLPPCTTPSEKINQQYSALTTILTFLKNQGGQLWSLTADSLLDYRDYQQWLLDTHPSSSPLPPAATEEEFQERSRQAWTYLLLQIVKVLVLPRVTSQIPSYLQPAVSQLTSQPSSNMYSLPERVLLTWLNYHCTHQRTSVMKCDDGYMREVVNFDVDLMDCTALACVLSAYCPFLVSSHFTALYPQPSSAEQCSHNALLLVNALTHIGIHYDCQPSDLMTPNPVFLLLLCCHLYQSLPSLSPSRTVVCEGLLHSHARQQISLDNPSSKPLTYHALLRGEDANKFSIVGGADTITVAGRKSARFEVEYRGHQIQPCEAILLLVAESGCGISGSSVAFRLKGQVTGAKPQSQVQVSAALYQVQTVRLQVPSSFQEAGQFDVLLYESTDATLLSALSPTTRRKTATRSLGIIPASCLQNRSTDKMTVFNPQTGQVYLEPGNPATVMLTFVPLKLEPRHCAVVLRNADLGEIVISVKATVKLPFPTLPQTSGVDSRFFTNRDTQTLHLKAYAGETVKENLILSGRNASLEAAMLEICQWGMDEVELKRRMLTNSLNHAALTTAMGCLGLEKKTMSAADNIHDGLDKLVFRVEGNSDNFELPKSIAVPAHHSDVTEFPVCFLAEEPGQYECHIVLTSTHDVRVFIIESTVMARSKCAELEFTTAAMQPLTQNIPLVNPSTMEWPLQTALTGLGFSGPDSILAQPLSTTCYPLTFNLKKEGQVEGELRLTNVNDGCEHTFLLRGVAEKPLAQDHIVLHAQAKTSLTHILHVPNHNERTTEFRVESDLACVSGSPSISIAGGDLVDYPLLVRPIRRGVVSGAVAFVAQTPSKMDRRQSLSTPCSQRGSTPYHVWFQLEVRVDPAPPDHVIPVSCPTLSTTTAHLPITNTQALPLHLSVVVGGVCLSGPDSLEVEANSITPYPLTFAPTLNGKSTGQVVFDGGPDGEFWYHLELSTEDPAPVTLPDLVCQLGKTSEVCIPLSNPLDQPILFMCECSNTKHFIIPGLVDSQIVVEARGSTEVPVLFKPSCIGSGEQVAHISFISQEFGTQVFLIQGKGSEPSAMESTTIQASLNSNATHVLTFTNPLDNAAQFRVDLQGSQPSDHFCLLMKRTHGILLHPGVSLDIPVMFAPEAMHTHETVVVVSTDERGGGGERDKRGLAWRYPIVGEPEFRPLSPESAPKIACQAKERVEERLEVVLVGCRMRKAALIRPVTPNITAPERSMASDSNRGDSYSYQLVCSDAKYSDLVQNSIGVKLLRKVVDEGGPVKLVFGIVFAPPKAFSSTVELNVSSGDGGVWKFPVQLSAAMANPDDIIVIEAAGLNKESQIQFRLTSLQEHPLPFTAHLAHTSNSDITVSPTSGELAPVNSKGTLFFITYTPQTYGRDHRARLIVQCESNEWCYEIVGKPALYSPPTHTPSRVQHRTTVPLVLSQTKKNFIRENMRLLSSRLPVQ